MSSAPLRPTARRSELHRRLTALVIGLASVLSAALAGPGVSEPAAAARTATRSAFVWGSNSAGGLGLAGTARALTPVPLRLPAATVGVALGQGYTVAVDAGGRVWSWGDNEFGQLGDGTTTTRLQPVRVRLPRSARIVAVAADVDHSLALTSTGTVYAWGRNQHGQLGDGTTTTRGRPVRTALPAGVRVVSIAAGLDHSLAATSSGSVYGWGRDDRGQLGDSGTLSRTRPARAALPSGVRVTTVSAGRLHSVALTTTGRVLSWGASPATGPRARSSPRQAHPVDLPGGPAVAAVVAGERHTLALTRSGRVLAWGDSDRHQLGAGDRGGTGPVPVRVPGRVTQIATGGGSSLALTSRGQVWTWGQGDLGQLGNGDVADGRSPVRVDALAGARVTSIATGYTHDLVLVSAGPRASISLSPAEKTVRPNARTTFTVTAHDVFGRRLGVVESGVTLTVEGGACDGPVCRAGSTGTHRVTATAGSFRATATLTVAGHARPSPSAPPSSASRDDPSTGPLPHEGPTDAQDARLEAPAAAGSGGSSANLHHSHQGWLASTGASAGALAVLVAALVLLGAATVLLTLRYHLTRKGQH